MSNLEEKKINMAVFVAYCNTLKDKGRSQLRKTIIEKTRKSEPAVFKWMSGDRTPDFLARQCISKIVGIDPFKLFPGHTE